MSWSGEEGSRPATPVYTINRTSGFVDFYPTADISALIENEFANRISKLYSDALVFQSPDSQLFVQIDYALDWFNTESAPLGAGQDTGSTEIFIVTYGYGKFIEGANKKIQGPFLQEKSRYAYEKDAWMLPIYLGLHGEGLDIIYGYRDRVIADGGSVEALSCCNIGLANIKVLNDDGTSYQYAVTELMSMKQRQRREYYYSLQELRTFQIGRLIKDMEVLHLTEQIIMTFSYWMGLIL